MESNITRQLSACQYPGLRSHWRLVHVPIRDVDSSLAKIELTLSPRPTYTEIEFVGIGMAVVGALVALAVLSTWLARWNGRRARVAKIKVTIPSKSRVLTIDMNVY